MLSVFFLLCYKAEIKTHKPNIKLVLMFQSPKHDTVHIFSMRLRWFIQILSSLYSVPVLRPRMSFMKKEH